MLQETTATHTVCQVLVNEVIPTDSLTKHTQEVGILKSPFYKGIGQSMGRWSDLPNPRQLLVSIGARPRTPAGWPLSQGSHFTVLPRVGRWIGLSAIGISNHPSSVGNWSRDVIVLQAFPSSDVFLVKQLRESTSRQWQTTSSFSKVDVLSLLRSSPFSILGCINFPVPVSWGHALLFSFSHDFLLLSLLLPLSPLPSPPLPPPSHLSFLLCYSKRYTTK